MTKLLKKKKLMNLLDTKTLYAALGLLTVGEIWQTVERVHLLRQYNKLREKYITLHTSTIYLVSIIERHHIQLEPFDLIALQEIIEVREVKDAA
jgi:hypothetical protein